MDLTTKTVRGIGWSGFTQIVTQGFQFIIKIILARLLIPDDFGIIGIALIFTVFIEIINELGISAAIIQRKNIKDKHLSTSFWLSILIGMILFIITIFTSPFIANFFREDLVQPVLRVLSLGFIISSYSVVHRALLHKKIDFKSVAITETGAAVFSGIVAVVLALNGFGVWSLVIGSLIGSFGRTCLLWLRCSWRPSLIFDFKSFKELFRFGRNVMGARIFNYISASTDYLLVGKFLSATSLGWYSFAFQLAIFPLAQISHVISRVTFPTFSIIQNDDEMIKLGYLKIIKYTSLVTFPMLTGLAMIAPMFVMIVLGEKWLPMIFPLQILCIAGALKSVTTHVGSIFLSKGRSDIEFKWNVFVAIITPFGIWIGLQYNLPGVAVAVTVMTLLLSFIIQKIVNGLINLSFINYFKALYPATACSFFLLISVFVFQRVNIILSLSDNLVLIGSIIVGVLFYFLAILIIDKSSLTEGIILIKKLRGK